MALGRGPLSSTPIAGELATGNAVAVIEAGSAADTQSASAVFNAAMAESGSAAETTSSSAIFNAATAEAGSAAETTAAAQISSASTAEAVSAADTTNTTNVAAGTTTESGSAADSSSAVATFAGTNGESGSAADSNSSSAVFASTGSESGNASDTNSATGSQSVSQSESGTASDSSTAAGGSQATSCSENGGASDSCDAQLISQNAGQGAFMDGFAVDQRKSRRPISIPARGFICVLDAEASISADISVEYAPVELLLPRMSGNVFLDARAAAGAMHIRPFELALPIAKIAASGQGTMNSTTEVVDLDLQDFMFMLEAA